MTTINFTSALLQRPASGPEIVEVSGTHANGKTYSFQLDVPQGAGEQWLKDLGFREWTERAQGTLVMSRTRREFDGPVESAVSESGAKRVILTPQAKGYDATKVGQ